MADDISVQSQAVGDFLKTIYTLQQSMDRVSTNALANALGIKAPSVTDMAQRMVDAGLVHYRKYRGVLLTEHGEKIALKIIRRHRLIELYLAQELGYALHEVHDEAENLEHAVSDRFVDAIAEKMNHPTLDPHGDPIPDREGAIVRRELMPLSELAVDTTAVIARFQTQDEAMLKHITDREFSLQQRVRVSKRDPFEGPITVHVDGDTRIIGHNVALCILVHPSEV